jgi:hypothetical protein
MPTNTKWAAPTAVQTLMQTVLDSLANNTLVVSSETSGNMSSGAYDNASALDLYADFELAVCYATAPSAGTKVAELYLWPAGRRASLQAGAACRRHLPRCTTRGRAGHCTTRCGSGSGLVGLVPVPGSWPCQAAAALPWRYPAAWARPSRFWGVCEHGLAGKHLVLQG